MLAALVPVAGLVGCLTPPVLEHAKPDPQGFRYFKDGSIPGNEWTHVLWTRDPEPILAPDREMQFKADLPGCSNVAIFANDDGAPLTETPRGVAAISVSTPLVPDGSHPRCSLVMTFGQIGSFHGAVFHSRNGEIARFPSKGSNRWLYLLLPITVFLDPFLAFTGVALMGGLGS